MTSKQKEHGEDGLVTRINKEEEKRKREEVKAFAKNLLILANDKYEDLPINDTLKKALVEAKRLKSNAFNRHLSYVCRLIIDNDFEYVYSSYEKVHHAYRNDPKKIREIEYYRNHLIDGDKQVVDELLSRFVDVDIQYIRQLARNANKEIKDRLAKIVVEESTDVHQIKKTVRSSKLLYRYLFKLELI